jgi:hypothetical protein
VSSACTAVQRWAAVAGVAGNSALACDGGQQTGEPAGALVVDRAWQAYGGAADPAGGQAQHRHDRTLAALDELRAASASLG